MTDIDLDELELARHLLHEAIAAKGANYVYEPVSPARSCEYLTYSDIAPPVYDDENGVSYYGAVPTGPACLVGHALVAGGVPLENIKFFEGDSAGTVVEALNIFEDEVVRRALSIAQSEQDSGKTWGEALAAFERIIEKEVVAQAAPEFALA